MQSISTKFAPLPVHIAASAAPVVPRDRILRLPQVEPRFPISPDF